MSTSNLDSTILSTSPWFQEDYRSSSPFRGKHIVEIKNEWGVEKSDQAQASEEDDETRFGKYSLVIVIPSTTDNNSHDNVEAANGQCSAVAADSGVGSMSPSPPKTPTPDYDSLEDFFDDEYYATAEVLTPLSLPMTASSKKVHFSVASDSSDDFDDKSICKTSSWRDALVVSSAEFQDHLSFCYRQDWVVGETKSKTKALSKHPILTKTLGEDVDQRSRTETKRRRTTKLVRRSSSLDRLVELRYSYRNVDRSPLLCDPDPLKAPTASSKKNLGRRAQRVAAMER